MVHSIVRCWNHRVSNASLHPDVLHSLITAHFSDLLRCGILYSGIVNMQNKMLSVNKHTIFCPTGEHIVSFFGFLYTIPKRDIRKKTKNVQFRMIYCHRFTTLGIDSIGMQYQCSNHLHWGYTSLLAPCYCWLVSDK